LTPPPRCKEAVDPSSDANSDADPGSRCASRCSKRGCGPESCRKELDSTSNCKTSSCSPLPSGPEGADSWMKAMPSIERRDREDSPHFGRSGDMQHGSPEQAYKAQAGHPALQVSETPDTTCRHPETPRGGRGQDRYRNRETFDQVNSPDDVLNAAPWSSPKKNAPNTPPSVGPVSPNSSDSELSAKELGFVLPPTPTSASARFMRQSRRSSGLRINRPIPGSGTAIRGRQAGTEPNRGRQAVHPDRAYVRRGGTAADADGLPDAPSLPRLPSRASLVQDTEKKPAAVEIDSQSPPTPAPSRAKPTTPGTASSARGVSSPPVCQRQHHWSQQRQGSSHQA